MPDHPASTSSKQPAWVPPGEYQVEIIDVRHAVSDRGNHQINLKLRTESGVLVIDYFELINEEFWRIYAFLAAIGDPVMPGEYPTVIPEDWVGAIANVRLRVVRHRGNTFNMVARWLDPGQSQNADAWLS